MNLTERKIVKLATERGRKDRLVFDDEQRGLAVRITANGGRSYSLPMHTERPQMARAARCLLSCPARKGPPGCSGNHG